MELLKLFISQLSTKDQFVFILCSLGMALSITGFLLLVTVGEKLGPTGAMAINCLMVQLGWALCATSSIIALFF